jgi:hypothetical protein
MVRPVATSTTAVTNWRRRRRRADTITLSSKPSIDGGAASPGAVTRPAVSRAIAAHTVDHDTPNRRAIDAGVASIAAT